MSAAQRNGRDRPAIVMVGTSMETMGGISTVVKGYVGAGLFERMPIVYVRTHSDGSGLHKLGMALTGYRDFVLALLRRRAALVHVHLSSRASFWRKLPVIVLTKLARKPLVLHLHGSEFMTFFEEECGPAARRLVSRVFDQTDRIVVLSPQWADNVHRITANPAVEVIFNGVPVPDEPPVHETGDRPPTILFLGRLGRRKGIYELLEALANLRRSGVDFRLVAGGDGEIDEVKAKAAGHGLESSVTVPGWIGDEEKSRLLRDADVFVLPSHAEGLPMSLLEAMAAGLAIVCTSVGGIPTAVTDGTEGFVVPPGNVDALAAALRRVLTDADLRARLGRAAHARARAEFDVRVSVDRVVALYDRLTRA